MTTNSSLDPLGGPFRAASVLSEDSLDVETAIN